MVGQTLPNVTKKTLNPALVDFLLENKIAYEILEVLDENCSNNSEGWIKVPDIASKIESFISIHKLDKPKNISSTVHYLCKRLDKKFSAINRDESPRPVYYRINKQGKKHISIIRRKRMGKNGASIR